MSVDVSCGRMSDLEPDAPPAGTHPDLGDTIELSQRAHAGQVDKCGRPYYLHPLRVAMRLAQCTPAERHAALLHDVVEDTAVTLQDLGNLGYSPEILELVDLLTRRMADRESHNQYIERIVQSENVQALRVKLADVYDNMSPARTRDLPPSDRGMKHRFARDAERLLAALAELGDALHRTIPSGDL
jgi:(p)ppGpp synthase/HD superfamily hydrolase